MSQYTASVPDDGQVRPEIVSFYESFYKISDTAGGHEHYADQFTKDSKLIVASNETNGRDGIIKMRQGMWETVSKRSHRLAKIFAFGKNSNEVMLYGTVDYTLKDGKSAAGIEWSARAQLVEEAGQLKMSFYQVYLDTAAMAAKAK